MKRRFGRAQRDRDGQRTSQETAGGDFTAQLAEPFGLPASTKPSWSKRPLPRILGPALLSFLALGFVVMIGLFILFMTFVRSLPTRPDFTFEFWLDLARPFFLTVVVPNTLILVAGTVVVSTLFTIPLAWLINSTTLPCARLFTTLIALQIAIPGFVTAMGWTMLVNPQNGVFNQWLAGLVRVSRVGLSVENPLGMGWVMGLVLTPPFFLLVSGPVRSLGAGFWEAAAAAGANTRQRVFYIALPLLWPAILGGMIYIGMTALSIFEVPALLGAGSGNNAVLATEMFYAANPSSSGPPVYGAAAVYGSIVLFAGLLGLYF